MYRRVGMHSNHRRFADLCSHLRMSVSWQVVPSALEKLMDETDPEKYEAVTEVLMNMTKLDIKELQEAAE